MNDTTFTLDITSTQDAFGDGRHPSTKGAIAALEALAHLQGFENVLDMGCGSGILALQAAYQWHVPVLAADISKEAVATTRANAEKNSLQDLITAIHSDGFDHTTIAQRAPYDVMIMNILAETLHAMAKTACEHLAEEGIILLSGILKWHGTAVEEAYQAQGLTLLQRITVEDWVTLILQKQ